MLEKIIEAYKKSEEFCELMTNYETKGIMHDEALEDETYKTLEAWREKSMQKQRKTTIIGSLAYLITHPSKMISAQKYYSSNFGKPCPINKA
jgi:hypothetical protein